MQCFCMKSEHICAGIHEDIRIGLWILYHDVHIHLLGNRLRKALEDVWPKGQIRHKVAVHDVKMKPCRLAAGKGIQLFADSCVIQ